MININLSRVEGDYGFEVKDEAGHLLGTDTSIDNGGKNFGFRPMQLLLAGLGSCSAIDIVSILKKQRQEIKTFDIKIEGKRQEGVIPSLWQEIKVVFILGGDIDAEKAKRACALSIDKYCSVAETLRRAGATIEWDLQLNSIEAGVSI